MLQFLEKIGEWNPQFTREIKGRLKLFPILVTSAISLVVQAVVFLAQLGALLTLILNNCTGRMPVLRINGSFL
ncbi:MAG: hypothetical protein KME29_16645 [Calothrix sp. FI2-JRJ7]|nr:hypothetical protein [Calothrix sp. FI2-JRJ7]